MQNAQKGADAMSVRRCPSVGLSVQPFSSSGFAAGVGDLSAANDPLPVKDDAVLGRSAWHVTCSFLIDELVARVPHQASMAGPRAAA
jgi:hypothetical protein